ncbi:hypothetical protein BJY52DRAFT_62176 [Lactarius psammicola]|nr:hypothetical protein BJY52DRAFT_62176 [Lactarius psammicola]
MDTDYVVALNNWLQSTDEGNVRPELDWNMTQDGPNNQATHNAVAIFRGVTLGKGQGLSKGLAKRDAAEKALTYLRQNSLPPRQA